ncbi:MAG: hypothetical protein FWC25_02610 [Dehalococcoidia bacterium]|nr:hypothetical protein [Dehalococcoidia bacterium]
MAMTAMTIQSELPLSPSVGGGEVAVSVSVGVGYNFIRITSLFLIIKLLRTLNRVRPTKEYMPSV